MAGYVNEKVRTGMNTYEATIVPEHAHTMTDVAEPSMQYGFTKKRMDEITKGLTDLQYVLPGMSTPLVFTSHKDNQYNEVHYVWNGSGRAEVRIKLKQYQKPTDPFQLIIYPAKPKDFLEKVKGVLGKYGERQGLQEVALRKSLPKDMTREVFAKFIGGKRKARKTRRCHHNSA